MWIAYQICLCLPIAQKRKLKKEQRLKRKTNPNRLKQQKKMTKSKGMIVF